MRSTAARVQEGDRLVPRPRRRAPQSPRAPEALLSIANCQTELKDPRARRRKTIDELLKTYPKSEAAQAGKERLASLR